MSIIILIENFVLVLKLLSFKFKQLTPVKYRKINNKEIFIRI